MINYSANFANNHLNCTLSITKNKVCNWLVCKLVCLIYMIKIFHSLNWGFHLRCICTSWDIHIFLKLHYKIFKLLYNCYRKLLAFRSIYLAKKSCNCMSLSLVICSVQNIVSYFNCIKFTFQSRGSNSRQIESQI